MADTPNTTNGRLLARIDERVKQIAQGQIYIATRFDVLEQKTDTLTRELAQANVIHATCMATQEERWEHHGRDHEKLDAERNQKRNQGDTVAAGAGILAAGIAAVYTALKQGGP